MKNILLLILGLSASFYLGFIFKDILNENPKPKLGQESKQGDDSAKVTGVAGIFFKSKNAKKLNQWYQKHLGLPIDAYGARFEWQEGCDSNAFGSLQWGVFKDSTNYFEPSTKEFMINYRVANLERLIKQLKQEGVSLLDTMETYPYGKFIHVMDIDGNKIELYEPNNDYRNGEE